MEWWMTALIIVWPISGLASWAFPVLRDRQITSGDLWALVLCIAFGPVTLLLLVIANAGNTRVIRRW